MGRESRTFGYVWCSRGNDDRQPVHLIDWRKDNLRLRRLEAEAFNILREATAGSRSPVMLYSIGKDSSALLHLAGKAFAPGKPPFPLLHVDTTWKFREMIKFRDEAARFAGMVLLVDVNQEGVRRGISPVHSGSSVHTQVMKAEALRQALDKWKVALAIGGARHTPGIHGTSAPELWRLFNTRIPPGESLRVFPLSNWTELDVWNYIQPKASRSYLCISPGRVRSCGTAR